MATRVHNQASSYGLSSLLRPAPQQLREREAHTPSSPPLRVIAMTDRRILRDCCPLPAVIRMCQTVSPDLPCYTEL
ncbi:UNVERIFIED_CONTAM: hypothetical protein FKN15_021503 [Acipenser sinensis]